MKILGLITEYNPFHNGHDYHIAKSKAVTNADYVVVVMSGNYVQRGTPAIMNKYTRAQSALLCGADLVIELPVQYASSSASYFAMGAISLLDKLGIIDSICFGSECGDIDTLKSISTVLTDEPAEFKTALSDHLKCGESYPVARNKALSDYYQLKNIEQSDLDMILSSPNNLLAIEYLKALSIRNSTMVPVTISRTDNGYHSQRMDSPFVSATAIRAMLNDTIDLSDLENKIPEAVWQLLNKQLKKTFPILENDFSLLLGNALLQNNLSEIFDINKDLTSRLHNQINTFIDYSSFAKQVKTKNITLTAVNRSLLHIMLNITEQDMTEYQNNDWISYIRILGFQKSAAPILTQISRRSPMKIISKLADYNVILKDQPSALKMLAQNIFVDDLYRIVAMNKYKSTIKNEFETSLILVSNSEN